MSLQALKRDELLALAEKIDLDVDEDILKKDLLATFAEAGITYDTYKKFMLTEESGGPEELQAKVLLKMDRHNPSFEAFGVKFSKDHPFAIVTEEEAQNIIDSFDGFRLATPSEAKSFYE